MLGEGTESGSVVRAVHIKDLVYRIVAINTGSGRHSMGIRHWCDLPMPASGRYGGNADLGGMRTGFKLTLREAVLRMGRLPTVANNGEFEDGLPEARFRQATFSRNNKRSRIAEECEWPA